MGGVLEIGIKKNPDEVWDARKGDRHFGEGIDTLEWESLFFETLSVPKWEAYSNNEDIDHFYERQKTRFQHALSEKGLIMLGRMWRIYRDTHYQPYEIAQLLSECLEVYDATHDSYARSGLEKLISACRAALKANRGVVLLSD